MPNSLFRGLQKIDQCGFKMITTAGAQSGQTTSEVLQKFFLGSERRSSFGDQFCESEIEAIYWSNHDNNFLY